MKINSSNIIQVVQGSISFDKIYKGTILIWQKIKETITSCFGSGKWIGGQQWSNTDTWKSN